jgi:hypothetical protein
MKNLRIASVPEEILIGNLLNPNEQSNRLTEAEKETKLGGDKDNKG